MKCLLILLIMVPALLGPVFPAKASAGTSSLEPADGLWRRLWESGEGFFRVLGVGSVQEPADSTQNPGNSFVGLSRYRADLEFRPDLSLALDPVTLLAKPRVRLSRRSWDSGSLEGRSEGEEEVFINEWLFRLRLAPDLFASYGRENLQWGPSYLVSPSNPFFQDNGRSNPKLEVPGMDFARLVWLPDPEWTLSLIANTDEGRQSFAGGRFSRVYALKVDYSGPTSYAGMILSHREGDRRSLGLFGGWTATDALLVYGEGKVSRGTGALYPLSGGGPLGGTLAPLKEDGSALEATILLGGGYTLETGATITLEYVHNTAGYGEGEAEAYYRLRREAANAFAAQGPLTGIAAGLLALTVDPGLSLLRQNYAMIQYTRNDIRDILNITLRWTQNLDDGSGRFISIAECFIGDHLGLFSIGTVNTGGGDREFGSLLDLQWMIGLEYFF